MKIAKHTKLLTAEMLLRGAFVAATSMVMVLALGLHFAQAQDPMVVAPATEPSAVTEPPAAMPADPMTNLTNTIAAEATAPVAEAAAPAATVAAPVANKVDIPATAIDLPPGAPSSLSGVIADLQKSQENVTVDDMVRAEDAIARLDLLLQIQKKVAELKKVQDDQNDAGGMQFAGGMPMAPGVGAMPAGVGAPIPASALSLPSPDAMPRPVARAPRVESSSDFYNLEQVSGTNGNYAALIEDEEGNRRLVRVGDKLGKMEVSEITTDGVKLSGAKGAKKTLHIKNNGFGLTPFIR